MDNLHRTHNASYKIYKMIQWRVFCSTVNNDTVETDSILWLFFCHLILISTVFGTWPQVATMSLRWSWSTSLLKWNVTKLEKLFYPTNCHLHKRTSHGVVRGRCDRRDFWHAPPVSTIDYSSAQTVHDCRQTNSVQMLREKNCIPWCYSCTICTAFPQARTNLIR